MGGKSSKTTETKTLGTTTTSNPYVSSTTNNDGTKSNLISGTALDTIYNSVNKNIGKILDDYMNPNLDSKINQTKLGLFKDNLNSSMYSSLENGIVNPLSNRNMLRSSQATDMYNNAANQASGQLAGYSKELIANSQNDSANMMNTLLNAYMQGYNVINNNQATSLDTSKSNMTTNSSKYDATSPLEWAQLGSDLLGKFIPKLSVTKEL